VHLLIYDVAGRLVRRLVDVPLEAGRHEVQWDGRDEAGRRLESGTYFFELRLEGRSVDTQKVALVK
jgi:flagellar hook assembly protein FlgD